AMRLRDKGMVTVWEQSERMSTKTKLHLGLRRYAAQYPRASILLLEPREADADMFIENPMNFAARRRIVRYGYESAAAALEERRDEFAAALGRHRIPVNTAPLAARAAELWRWGAPRPPAGARPPPAGRGGPPRRARVRARGAAGPPPATR